MPTAAASGRAGRGVQPIELVRPSRAAGGYANEDQGGAFYMDVLEADWNADSGLSRVLVDGIWEVTHEFTPSPATSNLYQIDVTIENIGSSETFGPIRPTYRRVMDWDVEPTAFSEYVTFQSTSQTVPSELLHSTNNGFGSQDPYDPATDLGATGLFTDFGPRDQGVLVDFEFGDLYPGDTVEFTMWYGAAASEQDALDAIDAVPADLYSLAQPDVTNGQITGEPNTFIWAYRSPSTPAGGGGGGVQVQSTSTSEPRPTLLDYQDRTGPAANDGTTPSQP